MTGTLEIETDRLLCEWARWYRHRPEGGYAAAPIDGNMALLETGNHRTAPRLSAQGKETRQQRSSEIHVNNEAERMEKLLGLMSLRDSKATKSLVMYYLYNNHRLTADQMNITQSKARHLMEKGFKMVVGELNKID